MWFIILCIRIIYDLFYYYIHVAHTFYVRLCVNIATVELLTCIYAIIIPVILVCGLHTHLPVAGSCDWAWKKISKMHTFQTVQVGIIQQCLIIIIRIVPHVRTSDNCIVKKYIKNIRDVYRGEITKFLCTFL